MKLKNKILLISLIVFFLIIILIYGIALTRGPTSLDYRHLLNNIDYENIPDPTFNNPLSFESTRIDIPTKNTRFAVGFKALNTLNDKANLYLNYSNCNLTLDLENPIYNEIKSNEVIESYFVVDSSNKFHGDASICQLVFKFEQEEGNNKLVPTNLIFRFY